MGQVFVFHGSDHKVGTTMVSQSAAEMIAAGNRDLKILFAALCGKSRKEYVRETVGSVEDLRMYLVNQLLDREELMSMSRVEENLHMIFGVGSLLEERHYFPEISGYFLNTVQSEFDLILVDGGNDIDNGLAYGALQHAGQRLLVTTQHEVALRNWERMAPLYEEFGFDFAGLVVNQYQDEDAYSLGKICKRLGFPQEAAIKLQWAGYGRQAEQESRTLLAFRGEAYIDDVLKLANWILTKTGRPPIQKQRRSRWKSFI